MKTIALLAILVVSLAQAGDKLPDLTIPKPGGFTTITGVEVLKVEPDGLRVLHSSGTAKVPFTSLSKELQVKYGYDSEKAKEFSKAVDEEQAKIRAQIEAQNAKQAEQPPVTSEVVLWTFDQAKAAFLARTNPANINPLDRDLAAKRVSYAEAAKQIQAGRCDLQITLAMHKANAAILRNAGNETDAQQHDALAQETQAKIAQRAESQAIKAWMNDIKSILTTGRPSRQSVGGG